jgi:hypothetical protein
LFATVAKRNDFRQLDASVGASGPHGFAVRLKRIRQSAIRVHRIPPRVRDDRDTPLEWGGTALICEVIWVEREQKNFCKQGWTVESPTFIAAPAVPQKGAMIYFTPQVPWVESGHQNTRIAPHVQINVQRPALPEPRSGPRVP